MLTILVGHRGVGKSSLLKRISRYLPQAEYYCLDSEIEKSHGSIAQIFSQKSESVFRSIEEQVFQQLVKKLANTQVPVYIAVGGGFQSEIPSGAKVLWLQRDWDVSKNIFFDRPSLNPNPKDLRIPTDIFRSRNERWEQQGYDVLTLPEGVYASHPGEAEHFRGAPAKGAITLLPLHFQGERLQYIKNLQPQFIELRDDLLTTEQIKMALSIFESGQLLLSFRNDEKEKATSGFVNRVALVDWPVERGEPAFKIAMEQKISSLHSEEENYFDALEFVEGFADGKIKWSPFVKNFLQLRLGHEWQKRDPLRRLFFPRSENGRWYWYRHLQKQQPLQFFRIDFGSSLDQPTLLQWLQPFSKRFAAVLGQPVLQSWSPSYHAEFFAKRKTSLYSIEVDERDLIDGGFEFLCELGLSAAAVTSPLKPWAGRLIGGLVGGQIGSQTVKERPLNTLSKNPLTFQWEGENTDEVGFQHLLEKNSLNLQAMKVAIWGGGGVLSALNLPNAVAYSARTGFPREGEPLLQQIDVLVWAAGMQIADTLPKEWNPQFVIDLNYRADSPARTYAFAVGAKYISGDDMFFKQAIEQQKIWSRYE